MSVQKATFEAEISFCYLTCFQSKRQPPVQNQSELHLPQEKHPEFTQRPSAPALSNLLLIKGRPFLFSLIHTMLGYSLRQCFCCLRREVTFSFFSRNVLGLRHAAALGYIMRQTQQACEPMTMACNKEILTAVVTRTLSLVVYPGDDNLFFFLPLNNVSCSSDHSLKFNTSRHISPCLQSQYSVPERKPKIPLGHIRSNALF